MSRARANRLYDAVLVITQDYLGPAAQRFLDRSIVNHLHKRPYELQREDLDDLAHWLRVSLSFLTEDSDVIDGFETRMKQLMQSMTSTA